MTQAMIFSADDGCDVGEGSGAPVEPDYGPVGNAFNGDIRGVLLSIDDIPTSLARSFHPNRRSVQSVDRIKRSPQFDSP